MGPPGLFHFIIFLHSPAVLPLSGLTLQIGFTVFQRMFTEPCSRQFTRYCEKYYKISSANIKK